MDVDEEDEDEEEQEFYTEGVDELLEARKRHLAAEADSLRLRRRYIDAKIAYWQALAAGDAGEAERVGERTRALSRELRGVGDAAGVAEAA